jgi:hypothetical protein
MVEPPQRKQDRKQCASEKTIQRLVSHSELDIIVKVQALDTKQDIGLAVNGRNTKL